MHKRCSQSHKPLGKTVSGIITYSKPISLRKAALVPSTFISAKTGASKAVSTYPKRACFVFIRWDSTVTFHGTKERNLERRRKRKITRKRREEWRLTMRVYICGPIYMGLIPNVSWCRIDVR
jgi:hypothetical protein